SLHNHSEWSDGRGTLEEIARHMIELGLSYWAITDHSRSSFQANGLDEKRLLNQIDAVAEVNKKLEDEGEDFRLLTGSEVDILNGGKLDFDNELLSKLDCVVASIHQGLTQSEAEITERLVKAAENPHVHMLGHMTGRLLLSREPSKVDHLAVIDACAETGTWIELNANPYRFDMDWRHWRHAKSKGVKCVINCDAHKLEHAGFLTLGTGIARKGWLTKKDIINTMTLPELKNALSTSG
ncbi:PHP domain-containing protein, partial [bacterium]|nr:PHP domain-containing protein [bacterium]